MLRYDTESVGSSSGFFFFFVELPLASPTFFLEGVLAR
jgi:hypothetical protein